MDKIEPMHVSFLANLIAAFIFSAPLLLFYWQKLFLPLLVYALVMFYSLIVALSNSKYHFEIKRDNWDAFFNKLKLSTKFKNTAIKSAKHG